VLSKSTRPFYLSHLLPPGLKCFLRCYQPMNPNRLDMRHFSDIGVVTPTFERSNLPTIVIPAHIHIVLSKSTRPFYLSHLLPPGLKCFLRCYQPMNPNRLDMRHLSDIGVVTPLAGGVIYRQSSFQPSFIKCYQNQHVLLYQSTYLLL